MASGLAEVAVGELPAPEGMEALRIACQELLAVLPPDTDAPATLAVRDLAALPLLTGPVSSTRRLL